MDKKEQLQVTMLCFFKPFFPFQMSDEEKEKVSMLEHHYSILKIVANKITIKKCIFQVIKLN